MVEKAIFNYYKFFDETIQSSTFIVLMISTLIFMIWIIIPQAHAQGNYLKGSVLDIPYTSSEENIVVIHGVEYKVYFEELN